MERTKGYDNLLGNEEGLFYSSRPHMERERHSYVIGPPVTPHK